MQHNISIKAPAKINLHLAIGRLRADGFHDLTSIFQAISLYDVIEVHLDNSGKIQLECEVDCPPEKNTMYRAAFLCLEHARNHGLSPEVGMGIRARKGIPSGAGLGGGSSDAAAIIKAMASFYPHYFSREFMADVAAKVGSDVPFFLGTACALIGGRGEKLEEIYPKTDYSLVVVYPGFSINTANAFRILDAYRETNGLRPEQYGDIGWDPDSRKRLSVAYHSLEPGSWPFQNDFFNALTPDYPELASCKKLLHDCGADFASLSGSGSTVFGVFKSIDLQEKAVLTLGSCGFRALRAFPLARLPDSD